MAEKKISVVQIGKNGLTEGTMSTIENAFKNHMNLKIQVLKSHAKNKGIVNGLAEEILSKLGENYTSRVLGHSIFIKKWRKARKNTSKTL